MIEFRNVRSGYEDKEVIHGANLQLIPGKITVLLGPNGCGKSTLLKTLVRIQKHTGGEILIDGKPVETLSAVQLARKIAYLPQNRKVPDITVLRMVLHGRFAYLNYPRRYRKEDIEIATKALMWAGMEEKAECRMNRISGGMQQKVYIAQALAQDADTILMDEPTSYLDIAHQLKFMEMVRKLAKQGKAVVLVLHDLSQALRIADEVVVLKDGCIVQVGTPKEVYECRCLQEVFGIEVERIQTGSGWHYICDKAIQEES